MQIIHDPRRHEQDEKVCKDGDRRSPRDEVGKVYALFVRVRVWVPVGCHREAVERSDQEGGHGRDGIQHEQGDDRSPHSLLLPCQAEKKEQDRGLDEGEDGVVEQLCLYFVRPDSMCPSMGTETPTA